MQCECTSMTEMCLLIELSVELIFELEILLILFQQVNCNHLHVHCVCNDRKLALTQLISINCKNRYTAETAKTKTQILRRILKLDSRKTTNTFLTNAKG